MAKYLFPKGNQVNKGRKQSGEVKKKKSEALKRYIAKHGKRGLFEKGFAPWNKGRKMSEEFRKKIGDISRGRKWTEEQKKSLKGRIPWNKGRKYLAISGERHYNWKGGNSEHYKTRYYSMEYVSWRNSVFKRDNYTCRGCGHKGKYLTAHHIKSFKHFPKLRFEIDNGLTLCEPCHSKTDNYKGRGRKSRLLKQTDIK